MADRVVSIGERGEDLLPLLYRLDALTAAQYARLCPQKDPAAQRNGAKSRGNPHGGRLSSRAGDIKRWSAEGRSHAEIAALLGVGDTRAVEAFCARRGIGNGGAG